jgi:phospholipid/cholesterol/gamma-HCH transport system permease protein
MIDTKSAGMILFRPRSWRRVFRFGIFAIIAALSPSTYNAQAREQAIRQVYFTAWQILPGYSVVVALFSLLLIQVVVVNAAKYGVTEYSLEMVLEVLVLEVVPLMTALYVALRSGAAICAEIALMAVRGELEDKEEAGASPLHAELVPRIAGAALSVAALTSLGCVIAVVLSYIEFYGWTPAGQQEFALIIARVFDGPELGVFVLKCLFFGVAVAVIPAAAGLEAERNEIKSLPGVVLGGLLKLFLAIMVVEAATLVVKYV